MFVSNRQVFAMLCVPGAAEAFEREAAQKKRVEWVALAQEVRRARNVCYKRFSLLLAVGAGMAIPNEDSGMRSWSHGCAALLPLISGLAVIAGIRLIIAAGVLQEAVNTNQSLPS